MQALAEHKPFFTSSVSETLLASMLTAQMNHGIRLSEEERTVIRLIAEGHSNREAAKFQVPRYCSHNCRQPANRKYAKAQVVICSRACPLRRSHRPRRALTSVRQGSSTRRSAASFGIVIGDMVAMFVLHGRMHSE